MVQHCVHMEESNEIVARLRELRRRLYTLQQTERTMSSGLLSTMDHVPQHLEQLRQCRQATIAEINRLTEERSRLDTAN